MKRSVHYIIFALTAVVTVICGIMMFHVNVNADMTKYLPDDSQMKAGLEIITAEFGSSAQMSGTDVHVMFEGLNPAEIPGITTLLDAYPDVHGVTYRYSADSTYTLFDLDVPKSVDQKALGKQISNRFGGNCVVETSQDGATPPVSVMIIAAVLIMVVLILMAQSWFEPVVILISTLMAVVLNMGTNALLPSVSITTNFIGSILQAVLSLDYCIILLNRYRQEQNEHTDRRTAVLAANRAVKAAAPSILSSALTTVVGLLMLCFMRLKIGADMGIVLAKGVVCSLICTFTVMPSLMLLFRKTINRSAKRVFVPETNKIARFVASHKVIVAVGAVILFFVSWYFSRQTTIFFSAEKESAIEEIFPSPNPFVLVYDTKDEEAIYGLADHLLAQEGIQTVISYPTLMSEPLTPAEMTRHVTSLATTFSDLMPADVATIPSDAMHAVSPEMVQLVYYMRAVPTDTLRITFPEMARFLHTHCASNPLFASYMDKDMRDQIESLQSMLDTSAPQPAPTPTPGVSPRRNGESGLRLEGQTPTPTPKPKPKPAPLDTLQDTIVMPRETIPALAAEPIQVAVTDSVEVPAVELERIAIVPFVEALNTTHPSAITVEMRKLTDTIALRLPMTPNEMSLFMGSTLIQTRLVYGYAPNKAKTLTPLQYVHLLVDDLFQRKGLAGMITDEQRMQLGQRAHLMDLADANTSLLPAEMNTLLRAFGINDLSDEELLAIAHPKREESHEPAPTAVNTLTEDSIAAMLHTIAALQDSLKSRQFAASQATQQPEVTHQPKTVKHRPSREDQQAELFTELVFGGERYTSEQMAKHLARLMELSNVKSDPVTDNQMSLLYAYYGSVHSQADTLCVGLDQLLDYVCDTLIYDPRLADIIPDSIRSQASSMHTQIMDGIGQLRQPNHSLLVVLSTLPKESPETYAFVDTLTALADAKLAHEHYYVGESVMYSEMRGGFDHEMNIVTLLTILAIFLIVAVTFRSVIVPIILVMTVMTAVYVNVVVAGLVSGQMLYLAYLIVQAILMGATIDYGILFANYYREYRKTMMQLDAICAAYKGSIRTILTSGLIMVLGPGVMALLIDDLMISNIVGCLAVGAFVAIVLILTVVPAVLIALDKWVVYGKENRFTGEPSGEKEK